MSVELNNNTAMLNLMRLTSPSLPIGAFAYSQGLEFACDQEWIKDEESALIWIAGLMRNTQAHLEIPILLRMYDAWKLNEFGKVEYWSKYLLASREAKELRDEDHYIGKALSKLLLDLEISQAENIINTSYVTYATAFSLAALHWQVDRSDCCTGYIWAWCENQVNAAIKLIPLGQTAGQRMISLLIKEIPDLIQTGMQLSDDEIGNTAVGLGIASANHETQYSRLFRS
ncbi:MAG: urease accessory protein UreF [Gammaproteobacteria bacterium]